MRVLLLLAGLLAGAAAGDAKLARACAGETAEGGVCAGLDGLGLLKCARERREELSPACARQARAAAAPCAPYVATHCADAKTDAEVRECLDAGAEELAPACASSLSAGPCDADRARLCPAGSPAASAGDSCLLDQAKLVSAQCRSHLAARRRSGVKTRQACAAELREHCRDGSSRAECLAQRRDRFSAACLERFDRQDRVRAYKKACRRYERQLCRASSSSSTFLCMTGRAGELSAECAAALGALDGEDWAGMSGSGGSNAAADDDTARRVKGVRAACQRELSEHCDGARDVACVVHPRLRARLGSECAAAAAAVTAADVARVGRMGGGGAPDDDARLGRSSEDAHLRREGSDDDARLRREGLRRATTPAEATERMHEACKTELEAHCPGGGGARCLAARMDSHSQACRQALVELRRLRRSEARTGEAEPVRGHRAGAPSRRARREAAVAGANDVGEDQRRSPPPARD